MKEKIEDN